MFWFLVRLDAVRGLSQRARDLRAYLRYVSGCFQTRACWVHFNLATGPTKGAHLQPERLVHVRALCAQLSLSHTAWVSMGRRVPRVLRLGVFCASLTVSPTRSLHDYAHRGKLEKIIEKVSARRACADLCRRRVRSRAAFAQVGKGRNLNRVEPVSGPSTSVAPSVARSSR